MIRDSCERLGCRVIAPTGSAHVSATLGACLPGDQVAAKASLVICNGGSPSTHQALAQGTPVLGIPANLDQLLNMQFIAASGAGLSLREENASGPHLRARISEVLTEERFRVAARAVAQMFARYSAPQRFRQIVDETFSGERQEMPLPLSL